MRPLTYYIGTSLDGYIAGPGSEVDFYPLSDDHVEQMGSDYPEVLPTHVRQQLGIDDRPNRRFDTVVMGRGTYEPALAAGITDPYAHLRTHVVSTRGDVARGDPAVSVSDDPIDLIGRLKSDGSPLGIWLAGGGRLAGALLAEIDELIVKLYPVLAGDGVPAITGSFDPQSFTLVESTSFSSGSTVLAYTRA